MTSTEWQTSEHQERARAELERLRAETRELHGEARLQADQHINKLNDRIAELEGQENSNSEVFGSRVEGLAAAFKNAWHDIRNSAKNALGERS